MNRVVVLLQECWQNVKVPGGAVGAEILPHTCLFSVLVRTAGCLSPSPSLALVEASCHVGFFFFSSLAVHSALLPLCFVVFVLVSSLKRLRLSRQVVKLENVGLTDCFKEPGWATTSRCDTI